MAAVSLAAKTAKLAVDLALKFFKKAIFCNKEIAFFFLYYWSKVKQRSSIDGWYMS
jgi:hypothetical protein